MTTYQLSTVILITGLNLYTAYLLRFAEKRTIGWWLCQINGVLAAFGVIRLVAALFSPT